MAVGARPCHHVVVNKRVLIVDDHPSFRSLAREVLEAGGYEVVGEAESGAAAIAATREQAPDVVLLDVQLPDMTGFDVCKEICTNGSAPAVVLVSSRDAGDYGGAIADCKARGFIPKAEVCADTLRALVE